MRLGDSAKLDADYSETDEGHGSFVVAHIFGSTNHDIRAPFFPESLSDVRDATTLV
jgi:hypothetical protein